jgi:hypothetical protein
MEQVRRRLYPRFATYGVDPCAGGHWEKGKHKPERIFLKKLVAFFHADDQNQQSEVQTGIAD